MTSEGNGVSHLENNMAVFIPFTDIGDIVKIKLTQVKKSFATGEIVQIIEPSKDRIASDCNVFSICGGCDYRHITYEKECMIKKDLVKQNLNRIGGFDLLVDEIVSTSQINGYRNKATYQIKMSKDNLPLIGFYKKRTYDIVDITGCKLNPDFFQDIINLTKKFIIDNKISVYDDKTKEGLLRHLYIRYGEKTDEVMVVLSINGDNLPHQEKFIENLLSLNINIKSIALNINKTKTNLILANKNKFIYGEKYINDILSNLNFRLSPLAFYQVNAKGAEKLYDIAKNYANINENDIILDLYCGVGTIGLSMAKNAKKLLGVDIEKDAIKNANSNAILNNVKNANFISADVANIENSIKALNPSIIILDPPRKGSDEKTLKMVCNLNPEKIIMISCNSATMARDLKYLNLLNYKVNKITAVDMFPRTAHVECVALLSKKELN